MTLKLKLTGMFIVLVLATVAACGGGGGTPGPIVAVITAQPADQSVLEGMTATFEVVAAGATGYQWQRSTNGGTTFTDVLSATTAVYTTAANSLADSGAQYRVVVSGAGNTVTSNAALLTVSTVPVPPAFTTQPADVSITEGQNAQFTVAVTGVPTPSVQWQLSTDGGGTWNNINGATGTSLDLTGVALADDGRQFRAVATNSSGSTDSNVALLTVSAVPVPPAFTTQPADVSITEGQNAQFTVAVSGVPTPSVQWQLSTDGGGTWNNINGATGTSLDLTGVALANDGRQFRAVATNSSGSVDSNAAHLTVLARTWGTAQLLETDSGDAYPYGPDIAVDADGNAMVSWVQDGDPTAGYRYDVWARRCTAGVWGTAALIEANGGTADAPQIVIDGNGNAIALWSQATGTGYTVWANRYTPSGGWGTAAEIGGDIAYTQAPQIAVDADGNALAVWIRLETGYRIWANRYTKVGGWGTPAAIDAGSADFADVPQIAMDVQGNAVVVWAQSSVGNIWANRYTAGAGWGTATQIEAGAGNAYGAQIAMDGTGNALAVWVQTDGTVYSVWSNRYSAGAWGTAALIETDDAGSAEGPQIAIDTDGNALAVWAQSNGTVNSIWANHFSGGAWGTAELIETNNGSHAGYPTIAFDGHGNALAVWHQPRAITWNRYNGTAWGTAGLVDPDINNEPTGPPQIAIDGDGNAWVVWAQFDFTRNNIWANRYQ